MSDKFVQSCFLFLGPTWVAISSSGGAFQVSDEFGSQVNVVPRIAAAASLHGERLLAVTAVRNLYAYVGVFEVVDVSGCICPCPFGPASWNSYCDVLEIDSSCRGCVKEI